MSAPDWLESLEEHIDTLIVMHGLDEIEAWKEVLMMCKENIDTMEGH